jgi:hypothetical protein
MLASRRKRGVEAAGHLFWRLFADRSTAYWNCDPAAVLICRALAMELRPRCRLLSES